MLIKPFSQGVGTNAKWVSDGGDLPLAFAGRFRYDVVEAVPSSEPTILTEVGSERTLTPTVVATRPAASVPVPTIAAGDANGTSITSLPPSQQYKCNVILYSSSLLNQNAQRVWTQVTTDTIQKSAVVGISGIVDAALIKVDVNFFEQAVLERSRRRTQSSRTHRNKSAPLDATPLRHRRPLRNLQQLPSPLKIQFVTTIEFPSEEGNDWNVGELVASAFASQKQRMAYVKALREAAVMEGTSYFTNLERVSFETEGELTIKGVEAGTYDEHLGDGNGIDANHASSTNNSDTTMYYILAAVVAGACILIFAITAIMFFRTRRNLENRNAKSSLSGTGNNTSPVKVTDRGKGLDALEIHTEKSKSDTLLINQPTSYIGTIDSKEGEVDDVSTLGDPYMGDAVNAVMDTDNTVGERYVKFEELTRAMSVHFEKYFY